MSAPTVRRWPRPSPRSPCLIDRPACYGSCPQWTVNSRTGAASSNIPSATSCFRCGSPCSRRRCPGRYGTRSWRADWVSRSTPGCHWPRRGKRMVLDEADHDTWSAGSFFTNPIVDQTRFESTLDDGVRYPHWPVDGGIKLAAAWLIERAGFTRGYGVGTVSLSSKHTLALTNRGGATTAELLALARTVRDGVWERFGVSLQPEPRLVGVTL